MEADWGENINSFIQLSNDRGVRMIMVGNLALNYYGYQQISNGVDFWVEATSRNMSKIGEILKEISPAIMSYYMPAIDRKKNFSAKFSSHSYTLNLLTSFGISKSFTWAYEDSIASSLPSNPEIKWRVLALEDLIISKSRSLDPQDIIDLRELKRINGIES